MPTLPGLTTSRPNTSRAKGMWVCPQRIVCTDSSTSANTSCHRSLRVSTSTTSSSSRGAPWQNKTGPKPGSSRVTGYGSPASRST